MSDSSSEDSSLSLMESDRHLKERISKSVNARIPGPDVSQKYRIQANHLLLTYRGSIDKKLLYSFIKDKLKTQDITKYLVVHETYKENIYTHIYIHMNKLLDTRNPKLLNLRAHKYIRPNIQRIYSTYKEIAAAISFCLRCDNSPYTNIKDLNFWSSEIVENVNKEVSSSFDSISEIDSEVNFETDVKSDIESKLESKLELISDSDDDVVTVIKKLVDAKEPTSFMPRYQHRIVCITYTDQAFDKKWLLGHITIVAAKKGGIVKEYLIVHHYYNNSKHTHAYIVFNEDYNSYYKTDFDFYDANSNMEGVCCDGSKSNIVVPYFLRLDHKPYTNIKEKCHTSDRIMVFPPELNIKKRASVREDRKYRDKERKLI